MSKIIVKLEVVIFKGTKLSETEQSEIGKKVVDKLIDFANSSMMPEVVKINLEEIYFDK